MIAYFIKAIILAVAFTLAEQALLPKIGLGFLLESGATPSTVYLPCGYGLVIMIVTYTYFWVLLVGMGIGKARQEYSELAEKDGEKQVEERYKLPNLYAQGTSKHARAFNCVQRSHQQLLETLPGYFCTVLLSGLEFPVATFVLASMWLYSRMLWVKSYAKSKGDPAKRYDHPFSRFFWQAKLTLFMTSWFVAIELLTGRKIFWDSVLGSSK